MSWKTNCSHGQQDQIVFGNTVTAAAAATKVREAFIDAVSQKKTSE